MTKIGNAEREAPKDYKSDEEVVGFLKKNVFLSWHPAGTCKMSKGKDAVVDSKCRVIGVKNLRVADASIMPNLVSGNTNMAAIVIGSRVADFILQDS